MYNYSQGLWFDSNMSMVCIIALGLVANDCDHPNGSHLII